MKLVDTIAPVLTAVLLAGPALAAEAPAISAHIDDLPPLQASPEDPDLFTWTSGKGTPGKFDRVMVTQPEIFLSEKNKYKGTQPDQLKLLADYL